MRVLTVARWYPSHDSPGRGSFVADLVRATVAEGVEARVASFDRVLVRGRPEERDAVRLAARVAYDEVATPAALFVPQPVGDGVRVPVARIPVVRRPGSGDPAALIDDHHAAIGPFVDRLLADWRPDVIHAHTGLPDGIVAARLGRDLGIPVVVSEHMSTIETELADPVAGAAYRELLGPGVQLVGVSPSVCTRVAAVLDVPADRLGVLPNPVDDGSFPLADPAARDPHELLWVGSIGEHKGIDVLLRAFATLTVRRPDVRLRLVGSERAQGDRARLESMAASLGIESKVSLEGWLSRADVAAAMSRAAVFVHASPSETFGVAAAEAILTGLPVAARTSGGVPWIIELSGGFGLVAATDDQASFASAIEATLEGQLAVGPAEARSRLVDAVGASAVARQAVALYETGIAASRDRARGAPRATSVGPDLGSPVVQSLPRVLVATERLQSMGLVAALPTDLQRRLVLVVPPAAPDAVEPMSTGAEVGIVAALPFRPGAPRPRGRSPLARIRRALWQPAPSADELLDRAVLAAAASASTGNDPAQVIAIDAPAAARIARLDRRRVRLAPGSLRWLADRWAAERDPVPPSPDDLRPA